MFTTPVPTATRRIGVIRHDLAAKKGPPIHCSLHGAFRLASNGLLEAFVMGRAAGLDIADAGPRGATTHTQMVAGRLVTEASGNMSLPRTPEVATTGVDYISVSALTHSAPVLDLGPDNGDR